MKLAGTGAAMADRAARGGRVAVANTTRCDVFESVASRIAAAGELLRESERLARGALALAIEAGGRLASAKAAAKHGEWLPGLAAASIQPRTAQRAIELHRRAEEARALPGAEALSPSRALRMLPSVAGAGDRRRGAAQFGEGRGHGAAAKGATGHAAGVAHTAGRGQAATGGRGRTARHVASGVVAGGAGRIPRRERAVTAGPAQRSGANRAGGAGRVLTMS